MARSRAAFRAFKFNLKLDLILSLCLRTQALILSTQRSSAATQAGSESSSATHRRWYWYYPGRTGTGTGTASGVGVVGRVQREGYPGTWFPLSPSGHSQKMRPVCGLCVATASGGHQDCGTVLVGLLCSIGIESHLLACACGCSYSGGLVVGGPLCPKWAFFGGAAGRWDGGSAQITHNP